MPQPPPGPRRRPTRLDRQQRRAHLLQAAAVLAVDRGVDMLTMESVAAAGGVDKVVVYRCFANRGELLVSLLDRAMDPLAERTRAAMATAADPEQVLTSCVRAWFDALDEHGGLLAALLQAGPTDRALAARRAHWRSLAHERWGCYVTEAFGVPVEAAVDVAAILLTGTWAAVDRWRLAGRPREDVVQVFVTVALGALRALGGLTPLGAAAAGPPGRAAGPEVLPGR